GPAGGGTRNAVCPIGCRGRPAAIGIMRRGPAGHRQRSGVAGPRGERPPVRPAGADGLSTGPPARRGAGLLVGGTRPATGGNPGEGRRVRACDRSRGPDRSGSPGHGLVIPGTTALNGNAGSRERGNAILAQAWPFRVPVVPSSRVPSRLAGDLTHDPGLKIQLLFKAVPDASTVRLRTE